MLYVGLLSGKLVRRSLVLSIAVCLPAELSNLSISYSQIFQLCGDYSSGHWNNSLCAIHPVER